MAGSYTISLVVNNGGVLSIPDSVTVTAGNLAPIADAGPDRTVPPGTVVTLNGTGSHDPNGGAITNNWKFTAQPKGSVSSLDNLTSATPSFTADVAGTYKLSLTVSDGTLTSGADQVVITAATGNIPPVANAGPDQTITISQVVTLTGSGSTDANNNSLTYTWRFESMPTGSTATLPNPTSGTPTFSPDFAGFYVLALMVNDGTVDSPLDMVVIDVRLVSIVTFTQQAYVKASNTGAGGGFGGGGALSGETLAVGAPGEASCATGINGSLLDQTNNGCSSSGAVYVFVVLP